MTDDERDWVTDMVREHYNAPPATPREEIWARLHERLEPLMDEGRGWGNGDAKVTPLRPRPTRAPGTRARVGWMALAATAVLAAGVGIGRWSRGAVPGAGPSVAGLVEERPTVERTRVVKANRAAAVEHLSRTEPLLTLVKSDVARGTVDAEVGEWAGELLGQTRFLLDSGLPMDPEVVSLLEDLELVLLQATLVASGQVDGPRARQEMELLQEGLLDRNVLPRIQAVIPTAGPGFAGS